MVFCSSTSLIFDFKEFRIYVILSFSSCAPLSFLYPEKFITLQLKLLIIKIISLKEKLIFFSISIIFSLIIFLTS